MLCLEDEFDDTQFVITDVVESDKDLRRKKILDSFAICKEFLSKGSCSKQNICPHRHNKGEKSIVCKHWLRGLCKKDEDCEFLHMYDMNKLPPCHFFSTFGKCNNPECLFLHLKLDEQIKECPWYMRGFCKHGPNCKNKHVRRIICQKYLKGFCIDGPKCVLSHPKYELPQLTNNNELNSIIPTFCALCGNPGHKAINCKQQNRPDHKGLRPLSQVTCYKCGELGHYANVCTNQKRKPPPGGWD